MYTHLCINAHTKQTHTLAYIYTQKITGRTEKRSKEYRILKGTFYKCAVCVRFANMFGLHSI